MSYPDKETMALLKDIKTMRVALEEIWELDYDAENIRRQFRAAQRIALTALERCGFAKPYLTLKDKP